MKVSGLVVTKDRPQFRDWWIWNIIKQTRRPDQLVVVDSTLYQTQEALVAYDFELQRILKLYISDVEIVHCPNNYVTGEARQVALELAAGDIIIWWDDDDWYHPEKVERICKRFESGVQNMVYMPTTWHLDLKTMTLVDVDSLVHSCLIASCGIRTDLACLFAFDPVTLFEDTHWIAKIMGRLEAQRRKVDLDRSLKMPALVLIHGKNTFEGGYRTGIQVYAEMGGIPFDEFKNYEVDATEWEELKRRLALLRGA